uniref:Uncharacterized protein n=1 Tax=mine drainage metagenome TaxID=410659 RepID=E6QJ88_9ZZZZ
MSSVGMIGSRRPFRSVHHDRVFHLLPLHGSVILTFL